MNDKLLLVELYTTIKNNGTIEKIHNLMMKLIKVCIFLIHIVGICIAIDK